MKEDSGDLITIVYRIVTPEGKYNFGHFCFRTSWSTISCLLYLFMFWLVSLNSDLGIYDQMEPTLEGYSIIAQYFS
jgi:hypothetical protein